jgi:hypothetical protein
MEEFKLKVMLQVPPELMLELSSELKAGKAASIDELISLILRDWMIGKKARPKGRVQPVKMTSEDQKIIEERLRSLGYV